MVLRDERAQAAAPGLQHGGGDAAHGDVTAHLRKLLPDAKITVSNKPVQTVPKMNYQNLRRDLGFKPRFTMETGMTDYLNLVRKQAGLPPVNG